MGEILSRLKNDEDKPIKIMSPVDNYEEIHSLIKAGADEFYCGLITDGLKISGRAKYKNAHVQSLDELKQILDVVHKNKCKIYLAFNDFLLTPVKTKIIDKNIPYLKQIGIDGIILADLSAILRYNKYGIKIIASSLLSCINQEFAKLLYSIGVKRIILDRQITLNDIKIIRDSLGSIELETFIRGSNCRNLNFRCKYYSIANNEHKGTHSCFFKTSVQSPHDSYNLSISRNLKSHGGCCGICALYDFKKFKINSVKIVGRGKNTNEKIKDIKLVNNAIELLKNCNSRDEYIFKSKELFKNMFEKPCNPNICYYPHLLK